MPTARFTGYQIIIVLNSLETVRTAKDVCHEAAISDTRHCNWNAKYGGLEAAEIKKIKDINVSASAI